MNKKSAYNIITVLILVSCATEEDKIRKAVEEYQALNMNDFSSYEFVSLSLDSVITHAHNISRSLASNKESLEYWKGKIISHEDFIRDMRGSSVEFEVEKEWKGFIQRDNLVIERLNKFSLQLDSLYKSLGDQANSAACEVYDYSYREKNEMGATVLRKTKLYMTPELKVEWIALGEENQKTTCNELPVILDLSTKVWNSSD
jgi:hypothetical protein